MKSLLAYGRVRKGVVIFWYLKPCPTCRAKGFGPSLLGPDRCSFCDGTYGGAT